MLLVSDPSFKKYGYKLEGDFSEVVKYLEEKAKMPEENNIYVRDEEEMRGLNPISRIQEEVYGLSSIEVGYCNGYNSYLNCLEYHSCPEVDIAGDDLVLILASQDDVKNGVIDSKDCVKYLLKKGEAVVLNPYTFHFSPCKLSKYGFKCAIILTDGTNKDLVSKPNDTRLWKQNKWLYAHKDSMQAKNGAYIGIIGENTEVKWD